MENFNFFHGQITMINDFLIDESGKKVGCYKLMTVVNRYGSIVNFVVSPDTYFVNHVTVAVGDKVTGFYDANAPVPLIFPPQYRALVMAKDKKGQNIKVDYFDSDLVSSDGKLKLNIGSTTQVLLQNNQAFTKIPINRNLIVVYGSSTKSIPAQTVPDKVIVMC